MNNKNVNTVKNSSNNTACPAAVISDSASRDVAYWKQQLTHYPEPLSLPLERPRPPCLSTSYGEVHFQVGATLVSALDLLNHQTGTTATARAITLLAAWTVVLNRLNGAGAGAGAEHDMVIGVQMGAAVGALAFPLRIDLSAPSDVTSLIAALHATAVAAQSHPNITHEQLVDISNKHRPTQDDHLFQVMFTYDVATDARTSERRCTAQSEEQSAEQSARLSPLQSRDQSRQQSPLQSRQQSRQPSEDPSAERFAERNAHRSSDQLLCDLELHLIATPQGIQGILRYAEDLFDTSTIERYRDYLLTTLSAFADNPERNIEQIDILPPDEKEKLLHTWNQTTAPYPHKHCIHHLFEQQVAHSPDATALIFDDEAVSYHALNARANRLAHRLIAHGVLPGVRVALCAARGIDMVVALMAILKAGGTYVPMDASHPTKRLCELLDDAQPLAVLCDASGRGAIGDAPMTCTVIALDADCTAFSDRNPVLAGLTAEHLAYIIYTSGSTGKPKGVMVQHSQITRLIPAMNERFEFRDDDTWCLFHSIAFDFSAWELWGALLHGARLLIVSHHTAREPLKLLPELVRHRVSVLSQTPGTFGALLTQSMDDLKRTLRLVVLATELIDAQYLKRARAALPHTTIVNVYGPTETTVFATCWRDPGALNRFHAPIGSALANTTLYVLDAQRQPVPLGVAGELYIGGAGVTPGYLHRPDLTAERFLNDPFSERRNARLYKTGDMVRYLPDGNLEFLGRNDQQVKIRGYRIELGEIEARLTQHPTVQEALVIDDITASGDKRLIAYVTLRSPSPDARKEGCGEACEAGSEEAREERYEARSEEELGERYEAGSEEGCHKARNADLNETHIGDRLPAILYMHLSAQLPDYMIPSAFMRLDAMPLTPNGKLDRRALPLPDANALVHRGYETPQGPIESTLASIWQTLFAIDRIGRHDHFFELGGHSMRIAQFMQRLGEAGLHIDIGDFFADPTIHTLAAATTEVWTETETETETETRNRTGEGTAPTTQCHAQGAVMTIPANRLSRDTHVITPDLLPLIDLTQDDIDRIVASVPGGVANIQDIYALTPLQDGMLFHHLLTEHGDPYGRAPSNTNRLATPSPDALTRLLDEEACLPFDLGSGPLIRGRLIRVAEDRHVFLLTQHHIVSDGWSVGRLMFELRTLYSSLCAGQAPSLPPLEVQYPDYAAWQRQWLSGQRLAKQVDYWRGKLADAPALLSLPLDRPRPPRQSFAGGVLDFRLDAGLAAQLRGVGHRHGATTFITLLAAWSAVLSRLSGQTDIVIGTPVANRRHPKLGPLIGFFVNVLALRVDLSDNPKIAELITRVRDTTVAAQEHQDLPFEHVVEAVNPARRLDCAAIFQAMFVWQTQQQEDLSLPGLTASDVAGNFAHVKFDIELSMTETSNGIDGALRYATDLFDVSTIARHRDYLLAMLRAVADSTQADGLVAQVDLLPPAERELLLHTWNHTDAPYPETQCIHHLFELQAARSPEAIALVCEDHTLSYRTLNQQANRLAHALMAQGIGTDSRVALCAERSLITIVALIAILKAGGAYVPMDPTHPTERLCELLDDAQPSVLLCDAAGRRAIGETAGTFCCIALEDPQYTPDSNPEPAGLTSHHLAYVIYTSGSTGKPKGVMVEHRAVMNSIVWQAKEYGITANDICLHHTSLAFDISFSEIAIPLIAGARLAIAPHDPVPDIGKRFDAITRYGVTWMFNVPSALAFLMEDLQKKARPSLRYLVTGGEALSTTLLQTVLQYKRSAAKPSSPVSVNLLNAYGPTETTIASLTWRCPDAFSGTSVPIGRPIGNTSVYVLDAYQGLAPLGVIGELYIGGAGVARGYLHRPVLTAERFLVNPFSAGPDARMYRTGDLVRYLANGNLEFAGRCDHQVKIRGFRIELGEIETRLRQHPSVGDVVVVDFTDASGETRLIAYLVRADVSANAVRSLTVPEDGCPAHQEPDAYTSARALSAALHAYLSTQLPIYMVPSAFMQVTTLPRTANGKLDRRALPMPDADALVQRHYEPPQGVIESTLVDIWQMLLGVARIGRHDHFFELGGHSLLAMRLVGLVQQRLAVSLPLATLFSQPILSQLAAAVTKTMAARGPGGPDRLPPIAPIACGTAMLVSPIQADLLQMFDDPALLAKKSIPVFLNIKGHIDIAIWLQVLNQVYARHDALRFRFTTEPMRTNASNEANAMHMAILPADEGMPFAFHDLREYGKRKKPTEAIIDKACIAAAFESFDVNQGPLIRATLIQHEDQRFVFVLAIHHLIADGWSLGILMQEIGTLYDALSRNEDDPLVALPIQYQDYAAWAQERYGSHADTKRLDETYWRQRLAHAPMLSEQLLSPPSNAASRASRSAGKRFRQSYLPVALSAGSVAALRQYANAQHVTLFMVLLSAWAILLGRLTGQSDVLIAIPSANRRHPDTIPLIGFFATTLPLRIDLSGTPSAQTLLQRVRDCVLEAQDHQDIPLNRIQAIAESDGRPKGMPLCIHGFNLPTYAAAPATQGLYIEKRMIETPSRYSPLPVGLGMEISEYQEAIQGFIAYPSHLEHAVIEGYQQQFVAILQACIDQPERATYLTIPA